MKKSNVPRGPELVAALAKRVGGFAALGRKLLVTDAAVKNYASGKREPRPAIKSRLAALGVPEDSWDSAPAPAPTKRKSTRPSVPEKGGRVLEFRPPTNLRDLTREILGGPLGSDRVAATRPTIEQQEALVTDLDKLLSASLEDGETSYRDRASVAAAKDRALRGLAMLRGELELTEPQVIRSRAFGRVYEAITGALREYPEAAAAVARALEAFDGRAAS